MTVVLGEKNEQNILKQSPSLNRNANDKRINNNDSNKTNN